MSATYVQSGMYIDYTPGSAVTAGDVVVQNELVGVAPVDIAANVKGQLGVGGVWRFPKAPGTSEAIAAGKKVYWDAGAGVATETAGGNKLIGKTVLAAGDDATTVDVRMNQ